MCPTFCVCGSDLTPDQIKLDPSMDVSGKLHLYSRLLTQIQRDEYNIEDEIVFSNHQGYIFHDSRGIEAGSTEELGIFQDFIRRKCGENQLRSRLHAIWLGLSTVHDYDNTDYHIWRYCVPMDNQRPQLDLQFYKDICPDKNGASLRTFMTVFNASLKFPSLLCLLNMTNSCAMWECI